MSSASSEMPRRPWVEPELIRHESLATLTQSQYDPVTGRHLDPHDPKDRAMMARIPGSQGFFP